MHCTESTTLVLSLQKFLRTAVTLTYGDLSVRKTAKSLILLILNTIDRNRLLDPGSYNLVCVSLYMYIVPVYIISAAETP
jgi:hypothetical protein